jgi:hypothetical protein
MASRAPNLQKQLRSRLHGLMKKANELNRRYGVRVAVMIEDGPDKWTYQSEETWPSYFKSISNGKNHFFPSDFITLSEYQRGSVISEVSLDECNFAIPPLPTPPSHPIHDFEDEDFALLQALGSKYTPIEPSEVAISDAKLPTHQPLAEHMSEYELNNNSKRPLPNAPSPSIKKAKKAMWSSKCKPVTRSVARNGHQDPYNFAS